MDLERKKLIYQKEVDTNKEFIKKLKGDLGQFEKENDLLKNEKNNLKNQIFEFKKENNNLNLKLNQIERELKDEKELVGFLKGFSISRKVKK
ncbi:hypothetical protein NBO_514g0009 [Nosema bombycis CQ1]|uniref:Uncharacterized protein n=1 Tax=Nosema bombycis (strain CQ1 / CVCC 102059) TaxID=578461 RepID=R0M282_NOSB1|nr:hypothetical protein NBO_514g0009 [Nosema bombycis CQ1]|eukprot:EOB12144.1 hypothetical protein NBO_514g0009 [Nosema bombycis CQ1]